MKSKQWRVITSTRWQERPQEWSMEETAPGRYRYIYRERPDRRKVALLVAVVVAALLVVIWRTVPDVALRAIGLRLLQGAVLLAAVWASWRVMSDADELGR